MAIVFWTALAILGLRLAATLVLAALNRAEVGRHAGKPPPGVAAMMDEPTYRKAVAYTLEKSRFGDLSEIFDTLVLGLVLLSGVLPLLFDALDGRSFIDRIRGQEKFESIDLLKQAIARDVEQVRSLSRN